MNYLEFEKSIRTIEKFILDGRKLEDAISCEGIINYGQDLLLNNIKLLEYIFDDEETSWIEYWIWELDFGERNSKQKYGERALTIYDEDGDEIPLESIEELYNLLTSTPKEINWNNNCPNFKQKESNHES